jgi:hypothetical protein
MADPSVAPVVPSIEGVFCPLPKGAEPDLQKLRELMITEFRLRTATINAATATIRDYPDCSLTPMLQRTVPRMVTERDMYVRVFNGFVHEMRSHEQVRIATEECRERIKILNRHN